LRICTPVWLALVLTGSCSTERIDPVPAPRELPALVAATDLDPDPDRVEVSIIARKTRTSFVPGVETDVWAYVDGANESATPGVPGPLIEVNVGDEVVVHFENQLDASSTIHWHGLRLDSAMDGAANHHDIVRPGDAFDYRFVARDPGVFWYHPHIRGDEQIERGMFGVLVVRDRPQEPGERVLVVDDVDLDDAGALVLEPSFEDLMGGRQGDVVLVNGTQRPSLTVASGSRERWTFVNASNGRHLGLQFDGGTFDVVAGDVGTLPARYTSQELLVVPGERWTIEIELDGTPGSVETLWSRPFLHGHATDVEDEPVALLDVYFVAGVAERISEVPVTPLLPLDTTEALVRELELTDNLEDREQPRFYINGEAWPFNAIIEGARVGNAELWEIANRAEAEHPFHIHGMFFQVLDPAGRPDERLGWKDTVRIPAESTVRLAVQLEPGDWMFHCQIPEHAERGMMGEIRVEP